MFIYYGLIIALGGYSFYYSSVIAALIISLYLIIIFFLDIFKGKYTRRQRHFFLSILLFSCCIIVFIKTMALHGMYFINYRVTNTFEHINLLLGLTAISYFFTIKYLHGRIERLLVTILAAFSMSVVLEIGQYFYREYYDGVAGVSHGLYNDSMIDLCVNLVSSVGWGIIMIFIIGRYIKTN